MTAAERKSDFKLTTDTPYLTDRLIFNIGIPIPGKDGLYIETGPWRCDWNIPGEIDQRHGHRCPDVLRRQSINNYDTDYGINVPCLPWGSPSTTHNSDVIIDAMASHITGVSIVYSSICSGGDKKQSKLHVTGLWRGIHRWPVDSPHKGPVTRKTSPFNGVIMDWSVSENYRKRSRFCFMISHKNSQCPPRQITFMLTRNFGLVTSL